MTNVDVLAGVISTSPAARDFILTQLALRVEERRGLESADSSKVELLDLCVGGTRK